MTESTPDTDLHLNFIWIMLFLRNLANKQTVCMKENPDLVL